MPKCPNCDAQLSEQDFATGQCPSCKSELIQPADIRATQPDDDIENLVDWDAIEGEGGADAPAAQDVGPPEDDSQKTIADDIGPEDDQKTISDDELDIMNLLDDSVEEPSPSEQRTLPDVDPISGSDQEPMLEPDEDDESQEDMVVDATIESGEFPHLLSSDEENKTIPDLASSQTVSDKDSAEPVEVGSGDANDQTLDSDEFGPLSITDDENLTVVEGAGAETINTERDVYPPVDDFAGDAIDKTIDSTELPGPIVVDEKRTVADSPGNQTIDMGDEELSDSQQAAADLAGQRIEQTLDSVDFPESGEQTVTPEDKGSGTVHDRAKSQTIQVDDDDPGTVAERAVAQTLDSSEFPSAVADRIQHTWQGAAEQTGVSIQTSLKADIEKADESQTTLVIQRRSFREPEQAPDRPTDYDLIDLLGEGGMGMVYAARQASVDRTVAIKMLKPATAKDRAQRNKFLSEAAVTGDLEHPNIVPIYDLGRNHEGALFYAMKRVQGTPWDEVIREKSVAENIEILMKVADAVAFAHARRVIHRDLKPENVMLGDYGEVLLMDWGLAVAVDKRHIGGIRPQVSMGGTPAYMAPEMAAGPFERISGESDVYLLGAILYEIITGRPPHTGRDVMKCLFAAAKNEIQKTDKSGELVDIALHAMHTQPDQRYASVKDFQDAIRQYQSHSESIVLATRAAEHLAEAGETNDYQDFSRALFGFQQAVDLWDGNEKAKEGVFETRLAYATSAKRKGDYDLGASLLDVSVPEHAKLHKEIVAAQREVAARHKRLQTYKRIGVGMAALFFLVISGAAVMINIQKNRAKASEREAVQQKARAEQALQVAEREEKRANAAAIEAQDNAEEALKQKTRAEEQADIAKSEEQRANVAAKEAQDNAVEALKQKTRAEEAADLAKIEEMRANAAAKEAKENAEEALKQKTRAEDALQVAKMEEMRANAAAKEAQENAEEALKQKNEAIAAREAEAYEAYVARIGAAAAKIEENAYDSARQLLEQCAPTDKEQRDYRNWEWGRLWYLCNQEEKAFPVADPLESVAYSPDGQKFVTAGRSGKLYVCDIESQQKVEFNLGDSELHDVAFSPDGRQIAVAGSDKKAFIQIVDATTGELIQVLHGTNNDGHSRDVLSVEFSGDGRKLLTGSYDETAKLWDLESGRVIQTLHGHSWWVWQAAFCPNRGTDRSPLPETKIVTVSQDGMAIVWNDESGEWSDPDRITRSPRFRGHDGPIYAATFSPDGRLVATGGYDKRILIWKVSELQEFDFLKATDQFLGTLDSEQPVELAEISPPKYRALIGHTAAIRSLSFTSDGERIASAGHDNTVRIWDVESGQGLRTLRGHGQWVRDCAVSPDDRWVLSASLDGQAKLWNVEGYEEIRVLRGKVFDGHEDSVLSAYFSADASRIVTASRDRSLKTWDPVTGKQEQDFREGHAFLASSARFFADGTRLVTAAVDNTARIWDVATGAELMVLQETGRSAAVAVSADGKRILTGGPLRDAGGDNPHYVAKLWDAQSGQLLLELSDHRGQVSAVAISPDGLSLYTGDVKGTGRTWNAQTGQLESTLRWHAAKILAAHFLPDNQTLLTAAAERNVAIWDYRQATVDQSRLLVHPRSISSMAVSADGRHVLTSCEDRNVRLWDLDQIDAVRMLNVDGAGESGTIHRVAITQDGTKGLTVNSEAKSVRIWDLKTGAEIEFPVSNVKQGPFIQLSERSILWSARFSPDGRRVLTVGGDQARLWDLVDESTQWQRERMTFSPHGAVASAGFSTDGKRIVSGSLDGSARVWDAETGKTLVKLLGHSRAVNSAVFSPDPHSQYVLTAGADGVAILWRLDELSATEKTRFEGHRGAVLWASFSADGSQVVTASEDSTARIWDAATGKLLHQLKGHKAQTSVTSAAFSPDGKQLVTGGGDNVAILWDAATGEILGRLTGHTATITSVAFSPDGSRILTGSEDYTAKLWDAATEKEILTLDGHQQEISSVAFSPDGGHFALTGSHDGTAILWLALPWKDQPELLSSN